MKRKTLHSTNTSVELTQLSQETEYLIAIRFLTLEGSGMWNWEKVKTTSASTLYIFGILPELPFVPCHADAVNFPLWFYQPTCNPGHTFLGHLLLWRSCTPPPPPPTILEKGAWLKTQGFLHCEGKEGITYSCVQGCIILRMTLTWLKNLHAMACSCPCYPDFGPIF